MNKKNLWIRIKRYRFQNLVPPGLLSQVTELFGGNDACTRAFAAKIAKKNGWDIEFAYLAVREYKKFVYLGMISPVQVTPPAIIDRVWHQHQLFTEGYRDFCENVLERYFDHVPELIPDEDQIEQFQVQYRYTLKLYAREFGMPPPASIWGVPKFDPKKSVAAKTKRKDEDDPDIDLDIEIDTSDSPLHSLFTSSDVQDAPIPVYYMGGGSSGGGGASGTWSDSSPTVFAPSPSCSSSSSTSSCSSSSCGGGGCGGG